MTSVNENARYRARTNPDELGDFLRRDRTNADALIDAAANREAARTLLLLDWPVRVLGSLRRDGYDVDRVRDADRWLVDQLDGLRGPERGGYRWSLLAVLVAAVPRPVAIERRIDPVWPALLAMAGPGRGRRETLPLLALQRRRSGDQLPMFGPVDHFGGEFQASALPVAMYQTAGPGAPLALRLLLRAILDTPQADRDGPREFRQPWRDVVAELFPRRYQPARQWAGLHRAIAELNSADRFLVPVQNPEGGIVGRRVVMVTEQPLSGHKSETVAFRVNLPAGGDRGPVVWRSRWFHHASHSAPRFALASGLSVIWDRPGTLRVRPARGAPFIQTADAARYPILSGRELASLAFPAGWPRRFGKLGRRRAEREAVEHLRALVDSGYCRATRERGGWRVVPGAGWPGWTDAQRLRLTRGQDG